MIRHSRYISNTFKYDLKKKKCIYIMHISMTYHYRTTISTGPVCRPRYRDPKAATEPRGAAQPPGGHSNRLGFQGLQQGSKLLSHGIKWIKMV